ncbi:MAG: hypothetical protein KDB79_07475 [Acidobacteria bacterium]|nr:hypothetical protein [Acidobacteriota bacterium]
MSSFNRQTETVIDAEILGLDAFGDPDAGSQSEVRSDEIVFQLGLWLSGLESFLNLYNGTLAKKDYLTHDWSREFSLIHSILLQCSKHTLDLASLVKKEDPNNSLRDEVEIIESLGSYSSLSRFSADEFFELSSALKESILLSEGLLRASSLGFNDWSVWNNSLIAKIKGVQVVQKLIKTAEMEAGEFLPVALQGLLTEREISSALEADLKLVLPYFARVLKWLSVIGEMLEKDLPLKPVLLLFARINEQMREMMDYINNRLMRYPNEEDELFGSLDSAAYTASIELRKVYDQELRQLIAVRSAPLVYAKIENSYALLNDSLQLTLVNFARLIEPDIDAFEIFPVMKEKEVQSMRLRDEMWDLLQSVQEAERNPDRYPLDSLHVKLKGFSINTMGFIFYKDIETVERFIEEIVLTKDKKDLVPILHRFGAYLETLLGQINMRAVLIRYPFAPLAKEPQEMFA